MMDSCDEVAQRLRDLGLTESSDGMTLDEVAEFFRSVEALYRTTSLTYAEAWEQRYAEVCTRLPGSSMAEHDDANSSR